MPKIKNMGSATMRFNEGIIVSGSAANNESLIVSGSAILVGNLHISGSNQEGIRIAKGDDDYRQIVFENDGVDAASFTLSNAENLVIMNEIAGKEIQFWVDSLAGSDIEAVTIKDDGKVGIGTDSPDYTLGVAGDIGVDRYIKHNGDDDTSVEFLDNKIQIHAGGIPFLTADKDASTPYPLTINNGGNRINFRVVDRNSDLLLKTNSEDHWTGLYYAGSQKLVTSNTGVSVTGDVNDVLAVGSVNASDTGADTNFFVSGSVGSKNSSTAGTAVFGGDAVVSGSIVINNSLSAPPDTINHTTFNVMGGVAGVSLIRGTSAVSNNEHKVMILYGGPTQTPDANMFPDMNFFVSGSTGSKGTANKGTSVFGGDVVVSGSLYARQRHINTAKFSSTDTSQRYVRWDAAGSNGTPGVNNKFLVPAAGRLIKVFVRSTLAAGNTNVAFHRASDGDASLNTTAVETVSINIASNNTSYVAAFSSASDFMTGDIVGISIDPTNQPNDVNVTCVWEFDFIS